MEFEGDLTELYFVIENMEPKLKEKIPVKLIEEIKRRINVNSLRYIKAEAISINGQRIINMTDIVDINNSYILVNSEKISSPYKIKAIGDQTYLESALSIKNAGFVDKYNKIGYTVEIEKKNDIVIPKYKKSMELNYIEY